MLAGIRDACLLTPRFLVLPSYSLNEAQIIIEGWRNHYNTKRPHSAFSYRPPAPETIVPMETRPMMH